VLFQHSGLRIASQVKVYEYWSPQQPHCYEKVNKNWHVRINLLFLFPMEWLSSYEPPSNKKVVYELSSNFHNQNNNLSTTNFQAANLARDRSGLATSELIMIHKLRFLL